jgi:hypothetical protein
MDSVTYKQALGGIANFIQLQAQRDMDNADVIRAQVSLDECFGYEQVAQNAFICARNKFRSAVVSKQAIGDVFKELASAFSDWQHACTLQEQASVSLAKRRQELVATINILDKEEDGYRAAVDYVSTQSMNALDGMTQQEIDEYIGGVF